MINENEMIVTIHLVFIVNNNGIDDSAQIHECECRRIDK
jgi:hypothetical protein